MFIHVRTISSILYCRSLIEDQDMYVYTTPVRVAYIKADITHNIAGEATQHVPIVTISGTVDKISQQSHDP